MPPVFGPVSPSPTRLKSCAGASATARVAVADREDRDLRAGHALLDDHRAARVAERRAGELGPHVGLGLGEVVGDEHALPGGQAVGLDDPRWRQAAEERRRPVRRRQRCRAARWGRRPRGPAPSCRPSTPRPGRRRPPGRRRASPPPAGGRRARRPAAAPVRSRTGPRRAPPAAWPPSRGCQGSPASRRPLPCATARGPGTPPAPRIPPPRRARSPSCRKPEPSDERVTGARRQASDDAESCTYWSRPGPTPRRRIGTPTSRSRKAT